MDSSTSVPDSIIQRIKILIGEVLCALNLGRIVNVNVSNQKNVGALLLQTVIYSFNTQNMLASCHPNTRILLDNLSC